jgi:hypothetical protein
MVSCQKFLEPKSQSEFSPSTIEQLNELILSAIPNPMNPGVSNTTCGFLDILSDDIQTRAFIDPLNFPSHWYEPPYVEAVYSIYTWQPDYSQRMQARGYNNFEGIYTGTYRGLVYINSVLDYIDRVSADNEQLRVFVKAQSYTLRAFFYLHLVNVYGIPYNVDPDGLGVVIRTTGAHEIRPMIRNTVQEVYDLIIEDLTTAIELFSSIDAMYHFQLYRANLPMALLLLSRTYLYMENWSDAAATAQKLITDWSNRFVVNDLNTFISSGYTNVNPLGYISNSTADSKRTQMFYPNFLSYDNRDIIWLYDAINHSVEITGREMFASNNSVRNNEVYASLTLASAALIATFDANDLRLRTYFVRSLFDEPDYETSTLSNTAFRYRAYGKIPIANNASGIPNIDNMRFLPSVNARTMGRALRFTESYLILAEAQAMLGNSQEAIETLNVVLNRRFAAGSIPSNYISGDAIELVRNERRREFAFENLRWFDLRRWGMPRIERTWYELSRGDHQTFVLEQADPAYTLPVPHTLIEKNPDLSQVPRYNDGQSRRPQ